MSFKSLFQISDWDAPSDQFSIDSPPLVNGSKTSSDSKSAGAQWAAMLSSTKSGAGGSAGASGGASSAEHRRPYRMPVANMDR